MSVESSESALFSKPFVNAIKKAAGKTNLAEQETTIKKIAEQLRAEYGEVVSIALADILTQIAQNPDVKVAEYALRLLKHMNIQDNVFVSTGARELERLIKSSSQIDRPQQ
jgi:hypothetical protein